MKAVIVAENKDLLIEEIPDPVRKENEVLVEVKAVGVNRADLLQRAGLYPSPAPWPDRMGLECAGIVLEAPENSRWKKGDRVCALLGGGGYAEKTVVPSDMLLPIPENFSFEEGACIAEVYATAYLNLVCEGELQKGETCFIQAGASSLGIASIQLSKVLGAKAVTSVGSREKLAFVKTLGVADAVNRKEEDPGVLFDRNGIDLVLDCVCGKVLGENIGKMNRGGRWIIVSTLGGENVEIPLRALLKKGITLKGSTLRSRTNEMKAEILADLEKVLYPSFLSGAASVVIHKVLPMEKAEEAHEILKNNANCGKVVLTW